MKEFPFSLRADKIRAFVQHKYALTLNYRPMNNREVLFVDFVTEKVKYS
jgi:hypothetical protein